MKPQKQRVVDSKIGDCFPACMASLLELPLEVMPNDHSDAWYGIWHLWLDQFGLSIQTESSKGAIWQDHPWIAGVQSKNYKGGSHAILMHKGGIVLFDPSTKQRYKTGESLLGKDVVTHGYRIVVSDFTKLHKLKEYREKITNGEAKTKK